MDYLDPTNTNYVAGQSAREQAGQRVWQVASSHRSTTAELATALAAQEGSQERSGPVGRAVGLVIRLAPITAVWAC
jgi:hypothetical protein